MAVKSQSVPYFRTADFSTVMAEIDKMLKALLKTAPTSKCAYLTASGTGAMEAAIINLFTSKDKLLIINGGTFGKRFALICEVCGIPFEELIVNEGCALSRRHFMEFDNKGFTGLLVNLDESSTGQLYDAFLIKDFCHRNHLILVIDAMTTFLCDPFDMDHFSADAVIISSQKGLALSPGLSTVIVNEKTVENRVNHIAPKSLYFNLKDYFSDIARGQTPYTPAIGVLLEMHDMLRNISCKGVENHIAEISRRARYFREKAKVLCVDIPTYPLSNCLTPISFQVPIAKRVFDELKKDYGYTVNPSGGIKAEYQLRISHIGDLDLSDYDSLISAIQHIMNQWARDQVGGAPFEESP